MCSKSELKELEVYLKKIDSNLFIWVICKIMMRFKNEFVDRSRNTIFSNTLKIIENCETLTDVKGKALLLLLDLKIDRKEKIEFLNELRYDTPNSDLLRQLKIIQGNKRLSDFIYYNLNSKITIKFNKERPTGIESLITENYKHIDVDIDELLLGRTSEHERVDDLLVDEITTNHDIKSNQNLENTKTHLSNKKPIFSRDELVYFYSNNTSLLVNLELIYKFLRKKNYTYDFNSHMRTFEDIRKKSQTIIGKKIKNNDFASWLYSYIEKNIVNCEISYNIHYVPSNDEERTNLMLHQLDIWFLLDESRYDQSLKRIQLAWNKKEFDKRKRVEKDKK